jgi:hypothetical protein
MARRSWVRDQSQRQLATLQGCRTSSDIRQGVGTDISRFQERESLILTHL